ncbi:hypothetical protein RND81_08G107200 [Saponaria officinalis]|uniref:Uncharacterized protein n=1 Tax=Saponaria officinalis TaxID=3572 RepID=A0AAW1J557_SAPOF
MSHEVISAIEFNWADWLIMCSILHVVVLYSVLRFAIFRYLFWFFKLLMLLVPKISNYQKKGTLIQTLTCNLQVIILLRISKITTLRACALEEKTLPFSLSFFFRGTPSIVHSF